jgi:hypothetical protein
MSKVEPFQERLLLTLGLVLVGITSASLSMWPLLLPKGLIGIQLILYGSALFLWGILLGWLRGRNGAHSPTGPTSNLQGDSLSPPTPNAVAGLQDDIAS